MVGFDPSAFRAQLQGDGARPNLFQVTVPFPATISPGAASQKMTFFTRAASLPGQTIGITPVFYFGREIKLAGNRTVQDWNVTVINDTDFIVRNAIERWMSGLNAMQANARNNNFTNLGSYSVNLQVTQFDMNQNPLKNYTFEGCWPTDISPIDLSWQDNDVLEEFSVTFAIQDVVDVTNGLI